MRPSLPLNALRAFEAGARHLSFTKASDELHVTQAAISHQVKQLEELLGVQLFQRLTRRLVLTEAGQRLLPFVSEGLDRIAEGVNQVTERAGRLLTVSVTPTFGVKWLADRLGRFWRKHPEIDLRLHHSFQSVDLRAGEADMAVRWGAGSWPGCQATLLMEGDVVPVCSPALLAGGHPLRSPEDLKHHTLLHERDCEEWAHWLISMGIDGVDPRRGPIIDDFTVRSQALLDGHGVALMTRSMIAKELAAGTLVKPFDDDWDLDGGYYIVVPDSAQPKPKVEAFRNFLLAEFGDVLGEGAGPGSSS
jgi:LysR family glycine cleavage system transcriptional activator